MTTANCPISLHKRNALSQNTSQIFECYFTILKRKLTSRAFLRHRKAQVFVFRRYMASRLFLFYLLFSILSSFFFFRRSWGDALRAEIGPQVLCASALCKLLCASCSAQVALSKCCRSCGNVLRVLFFLYLKVVIFQPELRECAPRTTFVLKSCDFPAGAAGMCSAYYVCT